MQPIRNVLIVGGVHGNELNGIYLIKKFEQPSHRSVLQRSHLSVSTLLANPKAIAKRQRYVDIDLNRCFDPSDLANPALDHWEQQRAKVIARQIQEQPTDFLIDLHTSTANMGLTLLLSSDHPINLAIAAHLSDRYSFVKVLRITSQPSNSRLRSLCPLGLTLEAGPIAQGILDAELFFQTECVLLAVLDYLNQWNQGIIPPTPRTVTVFEKVAILDFPRDDQGEAIAMIHPERQGRDYSPVHPGDPLFVQFDGTSIPYTGTETVYPTFIQESAYWEKGIAMYLTTKTQVTVSAIKSLLAE